jgi:hypothetical protein
MKKLKPYWFLEDPLDTEHKYYILMDFLCRIKKNKSKSTFVKNFSHLLTIQRNLIEFDKESELTQRTMMGMADVEKDKFYTMLDRNLDNIEEINSIVKNSIRVIEDFLNENNSMTILYNSLVQLETYANRYNLWDHGFIVIRKNGEKYMKVFSWVFSIVKLSGKESVALLLSEMLNPLCETTKEIKEIKGFLKTNIKDYAEKLDCLIVADINPGIDMESGTDIVKEKSVQIIIERFKGS